MLHTTLVLFVQLFIFDTNGDAPKITLNTFSMYGLPSSVTTAQTTGDGILSFYHIGNALTVHVMTASGQEYVKTTGHVLQDPEATVVGLNNDTLLIVDLNKAHLFDIASLKIGKAIELSLKDVQGKQALVVANTLYVCGGQHSAGCQTLSGIDKAKAETMLKFTTIKSFVYHTDDAEQIMFEWNQTACIYVHGNRIIECLEGTEWRGVMLQGGTTNEKQQNPFNNFAVIKVISGTEILIGSNEISADGSITLEKYVLRAAASHDQDFDNFLESDCCDEHNDGDVEITDEMRTSDNIKDKELCGLVVAVCNDAAYFNETGTDNMTCCHCCKIGELVRRANQPVARNNPTISMFDKHCSRAFEECHGDIRASRPQKEFHQSGNQTVWNFDGLPQGINKKFEFDLVHTASDTPFGVVSWMNKELHQQVYKCISKKNQVRCNVIENKVSKGNWASTKFLGTFFDINITRTLKPCEDPNEVVRRNGAESEITCSDATTLESLKPKLDQDNNNPMCICKDGFYRSDYLDSQTESFKCLSGVDCAKHESTCTEAEVTNCAENHLYLAVQGPRCSNLIRMQSRPQYCPCRVRNYFQLLDNSWQELPGNETCDYFNAKVCNMANNEQYWDSADHCDSECRYDDNNPKPCKNRRIRGCLCRHGEFRDSRGKCVPSCSSVCDPNSEDFAANGGCETSCMNRDKQFPTMCAQYQGKPPRCVCKRGFFRTSDMRRCVNHHQCN